MNLPNDTETARRYPEAYEWYAKREREGRARMKHATALAVSIGLGCSILGMIILTSLFASRDAARIEAHDSQISQQAATIRAHQGTIRAHNRPLTKAQAGILAEADVTATLKASGADPSQAPMFFQALANHFGMMMIFGLILPTVLSLAFRQWWYGSGLKMVLNAQQMLVVIDTEHNTREIAESKRRSQTDPQ
ncbi:MAG TPA: hypothetical protein VMW54_04375 [Terriglobia bacterium]|nr:hypothetical protein [Terriglobia bacterium]